MTSPFNERHDDPDKCRACEGTGIYRDSNLFRFGRRRLRNSKKLKNFSDQSNWEPTLVTGSQRAIKRGGRGEGSRPQIMKNFACGVLKFPYKIPIESTKIPRISRPQRRRRKFRAFRALQRGFIQNERRRRRFCGFRVLQSRFDSTK